MAAKRLRMRQLREILRLKIELGLSHRAIARSCSIGVGTVTEYLQRARKAELVWPLPDDLDDAALEARLFASCRVATGRALPDFSRYHDAVALEFSRPFNFSRHTRGKTGEDLRSARLDQTEN